MLDSDKVFIDLGDGLKLVAETSTDPQFKEIYVYLANNEGVIIQDLAIVGEQYAYEESNNCLSEVLPLHGKYSVKVYADETTDDWTVDHGIKLYDGVDLCGNSSEGMCNLNPKGKTCLGTYREMCMCTLK